MRIGIAGLGFGGAVHLPVFRALPGIEVHALLGGNEDKTRAMAARFGVAAPCTSLAELLDCKLNAVVISMPPSPAGEAAAAALDRGLAVFGEKPIAATAREAAALAARSAGRTTIVDFEFRELPSFQALRALVADGSLGRIERVRITWRALSYAQKNRVWSWKSDAAQGGGVLTLSGLHLFNLLEWLFGPLVSERTRLSAAATAAFAPSEARPAADTADLLLRTADGMPIEAHLSNAAADRPGHRWEIETERGCVTLDDGGIGTFGPFTLAHDAPDGRRVLAEDPARDGDYRLAPVSALAARFAAAVREGAPVAPAYDEGARAQAVLERVYESA